MRCAEHVARMGEMKRHAHTCSIKIWREQTNSATRAHVAGEYMIKMWFIEVRHERRRLAYY
jgi:hypothetical protein